MKFLMFIFMLCLSGCSFYCAKKEVTFIPEELPAAQPGENYNVQIQIVGSTVHSLNVENSNEYVNDGVRIKAQLPGNDSGAGISISGVPESTGDIYFRVEGSTVGTQCAGAQFSRTFKIKVLDNKLTP